jgi:hypothetical protein
LNIEWTSQHGCGGDEDTNPTKQNCILVLQYMCQAKTDFDASNLDRLRDGLVTQTQDYEKMTKGDESPDEYAQRKQKSVKSDRAIQEPFESYDACWARERNKGLFNADQQLKNNERGYSGATYTRQNPNGNRRGYECPEERDYWPYWHPSVWKDIAVLTNNVSLCNYFTTESFNIKSKHLCIESYTNGSQKHWSRWNNEAECVKNGGKWTELFNYLEKAPQYKDQKSCESQSKDNLVYRWAIGFDSKTSVKECLVMLNKPECLQAEWTRSNHLGNARNGEPATYKWRLPYFPSQRLQKCAFRIRYNITTDDYDPFATDSKSNNQKFVK